MKTRRLFHTLVVVGSAVAVPALTVSLVGAALPACGDDGQQGVVDIGVPPDMARDIKGEVFDIGVPPDMAHD
jgi:hypothetical protein